MVRCAVAEESECGVVLSGFLFRRVRGTCCLPVRVDAERYQCPMAAHRDDWSRSPSLR